MIRTRGRPVPLLKAREYLWSHLSRHYPWFRGVELDLTGRSLLVRAAAQQHGATV